MPPLSLYPADSSAFASRTARTRSVQRQRCRLSAFFFTSAAEHSEKRKTVVVSAFAAHTHRSPTAAPSSCRVSLRAENCFKLRSYNFPATVIGANPQQGVEPGITAADFVGTVRPLSFFLFVLFLSPFVSPPRLDAFALHARRPRCKPMRCPRAGTPPAADSFSPALVLQQSFRFVDGLAKDGSISIASCDLDGYYLRLGLFVS